MNEIFVVLILSAMVTTGHLKTMCKRCWNIDSTECGTEKDIECDGTKCMMLSEYYNIRNVIYNSVKKMCATDIMCDNCFSASTNHGFSFRVSGECREGDNSNAELEYKEFTGFFSIYSSLQSTQVDLLSQLCITKKQCHDKMPLNNFMCPSCYVNTSTDGCKSNGTVLCRGNEFECLTYRSLIQLSDGKKVPMSMQGCVTEGGCKIGLGVAVGAKQLEAIEKTCTPAIPVVPAK
ncbi:uncharacterized protein [Aquarana catesbeiana]|uniref:uncharacterized protein isoform X1 n=1 Tax=Aquarana catesbeiana TaxID=8400 RepID=UPI003CCA438E